MKQPTIRTLDLSISLVCATRSYLAVSLAVLRFDAGPGQQQLRRLGDHRPGTDRHLADRLGRRRLSPFHQAPHSCGNRKEENL